MAEPTPDDFERMGSAIRTRMDELSLIPAEVQKLSGLTWRTLDNYSSGKPQAKVRKDKLRDLSVALGWTPSSLERVLQGDTPVDVSVDDAGGHGGTIGWPVELEEDFRRLGQKVDRLEEGLAILAERLGVPLDLEEGGPR